MNYKLSSMKKHLLAIVCSVALMAVGVDAQAQKKEMAKTAPANIVSVAKKNPATTQFANWAVKSDIGETLKGAGPYTVFAPSNEAFSGLVADSTGSMNAQNNPIVLSKHVVEGNYDLTALLDNIRANNWKGSLKTLDGGTLTFTTENGRIRVTLENGTSALITTHNLPAGNGVIHVIDAVLAPK
jgi:uncharacterized surface protein with fasciclin (FAS1) repeats